MIKNRSFTGRIILLVVLTVVIIFAGVMIPRLLIDRKINDSTRYKDRVEIEPISPYGENSVEVEERIKRDLQSDIGFWEMEYDDFARYNNNINDFTLELFDLVEDGFGVRHSNTYLSVNRELEIMRVSDFTYDEAILFADMPSGIVLQGEISFTSNEYSMRLFWQNILALYSKYLGIEFVETYAEQDEYGDYTAEASTTDTVLTLVLYENIAAISERPYEDSYSVTIYLEIRM